MTNSFFYPAFMTGTQNVWQQQSKNLICCYFASFLFLLFFTFFIGLFFIIVMRVYYRLSTVSSLATSNLERKANWNKGKEWSAELKRDITVKNGRNDLLS
ncbi:MAG: hypothetical protein WA421_09070 [Nitrososphaeraceae archaeon]